jgi:hypothetical protein
MLARVITFGMSTSITTDNFSDNRRVIFRRMSLIQNGFLLETSQQNNRQNYAQKTAVGQLTTVFLSIWLEVWPPTSFT